MNNSDESSSKKSSIEQARVLKDRILASSSVLSDPSLLCTTYYFPPARKVMDRFACSQVVLLFSLRLDISKIENFCNTC